MLDINVLLEEAVAVKASDIHLSVGTPPVFRINGSLVRVSINDEPLPTLSPEDTLLAAQAIMSEEQFKMWREKGELDLSYSYSGIGRFRVNVFKQRGGTSMAIRPVPFEVPRLENLGVPAVVATLADKVNGLVLMTGPTGSGKSTTLAALIDKINRERSCHIITLEDPIEFLHKHQKGLVNQREVGSDTKSLSIALRSCLRQDPDVILVGEMRDLETISTAITAAETGHLVFATLHTNSAPQSIERIIDVFPPDQQDQIRVQLSSTLQGVITQQLIPLPDGQGRVLAAEVMLVNSAVRNLIREGKTHQMPTVMQTGARWGMQTMEMALRELIRSGKITLETAQEYCNDPEDLARLIRTIG